MGTEQDEQFFISESIRHARQLPLPDCARYLCGFWAAIGSAHPAAPAISSVCDSLRSSDQQLDLIQLGQLRLNLEGEA
jgi:hypothetical protein